MKGDCSTGKSGLLYRRIVQPTLYSLRGLKAAFLCEEAFRFEVVLALLLLPVALMVADNGIEFLWLVLASMLVLITELINSAIEATVDRISDEHHELSGRAKDIGSAAVMLSMGFFMVTWFVIGVM